MSSRFWIRAPQLRGVLLPLGVALIMIVALALYGLVWIPSQQQYLNERNLRVLRTMGTQIKGKVDGFDQAIDHAIESFLPPDKKLSEKDPAFQALLKRLAEGVRKFAPDLEVLEKPEEGSAERIMYNNPGDPPRVAIRKD